MEELVVLWKGYFTKTDGKRRTQKVIVSQVGLHYCHVIFVGFGIAMRCHDEEARSPLGCWTSATNSCCAVNFVPHMLQRVLEAISASEYHETLATWLSCRCLQRVAKFIAMYCSASSITWRLQEATSSASRNSLVWKH